MKLLIKNIKKLYGTHAPTEALRLNDMKHIPSLADAWLSVDAEEFEDMGTMKTCPSESNYDEVIDANGCMVLPGLIDSHTHAVFAYTREGEYVQRIEGKSYEEIAAAGGGILNSAKTLAHTSEEQLYEDALARLYEWASFGTGVFEIKSGYGLSVDAELKMLRVIKRLKEESPFPIKSSFLGAHAYPLEYKENHQGYLDLIINEMLPKIAQEGLADYVDAFCEKGFFSVEETEQVLKASAQYGLKPKIHANQLYNSGGVQLGVKYKAVSVDHLETIDDDEILALKSSNTIATLLPGAAFFLAMGYQPARRLLDEGVAVALASDFNPGSCPTGNLQLMMTLGTTQMKMTPEECLNALTINAATALEWQDTYGSIAKGKKANFLITNQIPSLEYISYYYGANHIAQNFVHGKKIKTP